MSRLKALQNLFRQSFESSPESRGSQTSGVLLVLFVHAKRINPFPFWEVPRFCKPRISAHKQQTHAIQFNPFFALRRCPCGTAHAVCFSPPLRGFSFRLAAVSCCCRNKLCSSAKNQNLHFIHTTARTSCYTIQKAE